MNEIELVVYGVVGFAMSLLSGASGGGGGFIMTPLMIFLGLSPAQAVANGKFGGIFVTLGSLGGLRKHKVYNKRLSAVLIVFGVLAGLIASRVIVSIDSSSYQTILGILLVVLSPLLVYKKVGHSSKETSRVRKIMGLFFVAISMIMVGIFSAGLGIFINIAMMGFLGMSALDASVIKRYAQLFLNTTIIIGLLGSGLFILDVILVSLVSATLGGYFGGKFAVKKGSKFVSALIAVAAFLSGLYLIVI